MVFLRSNDKKKVHFWRRCPVKETKTWGATRDYRKGEIGEGISGFFFYYYSYFKPGENMGKQQFDIIPGN